MENVADINPRLSQLDGKTIGLVWSGTHGGDVALNRVGEMLQERFEGVETRFYTGGNYPNPPAHPQAGCGRVRCRRRSDRRLRDVRVVDGPRHD